ncbi:hypothetical protein L2Y94_13340 [Luteibacter aegosomatis]|uniref:hypothetical protein n=1 Tax=Luteibacter aegosomatis TaxID=2911537 RepID=UPI001FF8F62F|nr:hypothetical protein [Luteibacter aegosomatis]UPG84325.1 hypothetical protein L2Y94_13340 [Luteibacter aegosomatis]
MRGFSFPTTPLMSDFFLQQGEPDVVKWDVISVSDRQSIRILVDAVTPLRPQGLWLRCDEGIEVAGERKEQTVLMFHDAPHEVEMVCHSGNGLLSLYNVWEDNKQRRSQLRMTGMKKRPIEGGYQYQCTDTGPEADFSRFVFKLLIG